MTLTVIQASTTKSAAFNGAGLDVSGITGDWTLKLQVESLSDAKLARFAFEDTVNDWTAALAGPTFSFKGAIAKTYDKVKSFKKQDFPDLRLGTTAAQLRLAVTRIDSGASVRYRAWLEY